MSTRRLQPSIAVLIAVSACGVARADFTLISQSRSVIASVGIQDGAESDGDFVREFAPDFGPFDAVAPASAALNGATAGGMVEQNSIAQTDFLSAAITAHASLDTPGGFDFVGASITGAYDVVFDIDRTTDVLITSERSSTFTSPGIYGQTFVQLSRVIPCPAPCDVDEDCPLSGCGGDPNPGDGNPQGFCTFDNCLIFDTITCGTVFTLAPGRYELVITATAQAFEDSGGAASGTSDSAVVASLRPTSTAVGEVTFQVDTNQSGIDLTVQFPGGQPQNFSLSLEGAMSLLMTFSCGYDTAQLTEMDLSVPEQVDLVPDAGLALGGVISVTDIGVHLASAGPPAPLTGGAGTLAGYEVQGTGAVIGPEQQGFAFFLVLLNCLVETLCSDPDGCTCFADPNEDCLYVAPGVPFSLTLPGINIVTPIDLGLGAGNPTAQMTGTIVANAVISSPCPWDCADGDGTVGIGDFLALLAQWGGEGTACDLGLGGAGVGIEEFLDQLANWGPCP